MHHNGDPDLLTILDGARQLRGDDMTVRRWITQGVLEAMTLPHHGTRQSNRLCRAPLEALLFPGHMPNGGPTTGLTDVGQPSVLQRSSALEAEKRPDNGTSPAAYFRALGHLERYVRDGLSVPSERSMTMDMDPDLFQIEKEWLIHLESDQRCTPVTRARAQYFRQHILSALWPVFADSIRRQALILAINLHPEVRWWCLARQNQAQLVIASQAASLYALRVLYSRSPLDSNDLGTAVV